jgi:gliding motility-associated-like protein
VPLTVSFTNQSIYGEEYLWEFDDGSTSNEFEPTHTFYEPGYYQVRLTVTGEGGLDFAFAWVDVYLLPEVDFLVEPSLVMLPDQAAKAFNFTKYGTTYLWDFGDGTTSDARDTSHLYTHVGVYDVTLTAWTEHGCEAEKVIPEAVTVVAEGSVLFPNAFRPNTSGPSGGWYPANDVSNRIFHPFHEGVILYELIIYDRWGEQLFRSNDVNQGWDGYWNGQLCAQDVYVWKAVVTYVNGQTESLAGDVTLLHMED